MEPEFYVKNQSSVLATKKCLTHYTLNIASPQVWVSLWLEPLEKSARSLYISEKREGDKWVSKDGNWR